MNRKAPFDESVKDTYIRTMEALDAAFDMATNNGDDYNDLGDYIDVARNNINKLYYGDDRTY
jgi:hypothetical protein